jgi:hypothetical protein
MHLKKFSAMLHAFCEDTAQYIDKKGLARTQSGHIATAARNIYDEAFFHITGSSLIDASNHEQLAIEAVQQKQASALREVFGELLLKAPALDHPDQRLELLIYRPTTQPKISFSVYGMRIGGSSGQLFSTVMKKLEDAVGHLQGLSKPGDRTFEVNGTILRANDLQSAYRIWAAFSAPELFTKPSDRIDAVHEIFSEEQCAAAKAALLTKARA